MNFNNLYINYKKHKKNTAKSIIEYMSNEKDTLKNILNNNISDLKKYGVEEFKIKAVGSSSNGTVLINNNNKSDSDFDVLLKLSEEEYNKLDAELGKKIGLDIYEQIKLLVQKRYKSSYQRVITIKKQYNNFNFSSDIFVGFFIIKKIILSQHFIIIMKKIKLKKKKEKYMKCVKMKYLLR